MTEPVVLTIKEFCRDYRRSKSETYRMLADGRLQAIKAGTTTLITGASVKAWLLSLPSWSTNQSTNKAGIGGDSRGRVGKAKIENASNIKANETPRSV